MKTLRKIMSSIKNILRMESISSGDAENLNSGFLQATKQLQQKEIAGFVAPLPIEEAADLLSQSTGKLKSYLLKNGITTSEITRITDIINRLIQNSIKNKSFSLDDHKKILKFINRVQKSQLTEEDLTELAYEGNLGFHEMIMFYQKANDKQIDLLEYLMKKNKTTLAWKLVQKVTGMKLKGNEFGN